MPRARQTPFEQQRSFAKGRERLARSGCEGVTQLLHTFDEPHAAPAATARGLHEERESDPSRFLLQRREVRRDSMVARNDRDVRALHQRFRARFGPHQLHRGRRRTDEGHAGRRAGLGEGCVLGEKTIAGMDRLGPASPRNIDDLVDRKIALAGGRRADQPGFVGLLHMQRSGVGLRVDGDRLHAEPVRRAHDPAGDLAAISDQQLAKHRPRSRRMPISERAFRGRRSVPPAPRWRRAALRADAPTPPQGHHCRSGMRLAR